MKKSLLFYFAVFVSLCLTVLTNPCHAGTVTGQDAPNGRGEGSRPVPMTRIGFSYTPVYQLKSDLDGGGQFDVQRHFIRFDASRSIDTRWTAGLGLSLDYERWNFSSIANLPDIDLWDQIYMPGLSLPVFYSPSRRYRFGVIPSINFSGASGAEISESLSFGMVLSAAYVVGRDLMLGIGAGMFERLGQTEVFPYVVINWKINEQFRLSNPFRAGPVGPAGMELTYTFMEKLELGIGGTYRSYRFRLDDSSTVADGIAENNFWAPFVRVGWKFNESYRVDLNGGILLNGNLSIEDTDGNELSETDYTSAPFVGLTCKGRF